MCGTRRNKALFACSTDKKGRRVRRPFLLRAMGVTLIGLLALASPAQAAMRGYIVTSFDTIRIEAPVRVVLQTGSGTSAMGEGDRAALDRVNLSVSGQVLTIRLADTAAGWDSGLESVPTIHLSTGQLRRAILMGGGVLTISELEGLEADLLLSGGGTLVAQRINVERLSISVGGSGALTAAGTTRDLRVAVSGQGSLDASGLRANTASVMNDGPGAIHVRVDGPVKIVSTGSGDTVVDGKPICTVTRRGAGEVRCGS